MLVVSILQSKDRMLGGLKNNTQSVVERIERNVSSKWSMKVNKNIFDI
jgi:hypothetical protein